MCLVIDANKAADFAKQDRPYMKCLLGWVNKGGKVISGGLLERELGKINAMRVLMIEWSRRGNLVKVSSEKIDQTVARIAPACRSNDAHVLALAIIGRADVVVTEDKLLIDDLRDASIVNYKRRIYKENSASPNRTDRHLLLLQRLGCP